MVRWLEETHGVKFELVRHFLARMFDSDMSSATGEWRSVVLGAFALAFPAGLLFMDPRYALKYGRLSRLASPEPFRAAVLVDQIAVLTLLSAIAGIAALLEWQSLFPASRDYTAMAGLPVRSRQIFAARFATVLLFAVALVLLLNVLPSVVVPWRFGGRWQKNPSLAAGILAQAVSAGLACLFVLFSLVSLHGLLLNLTPARLFARLSTYVQGGLFAALFFAALYSWSLPDWQDEILATLQELGAWAPPVWFAGLHETLVGDRDPFFASMAARALYATGAAFALAAAMYLVTYRRYRKLLLERPIQFAAPPAFGWNTLRLLAPKPRQEAVVHFMTKTLARSRLHRLVVLAYFGAALGVVLNSSLLAGAAVRWNAGWRAAVQFIVLYWPLTISVIMLAGMRHAFSIPVELNANWIFQMTEAQGRREWASAVERFVIVTAVLPLYLVTGPLALMVLGWEIAPRMILLQLLVSLAMFEVRFYTWQQLPFTCSYLPGKRSLMGLLASWLAALGVLAPALSIIIAAVSRTAVTFYICLVPVAGAWIWLRRLRRDGWGEAKILYEDTPEAVAGLGLSAR